MSSTIATDFTPRWWVPGDWNGFFGLFTNVLLNVIVLTGLCLGVVQLPGDVVFGRVLPALGIALPLGNLYYAYLAWRLLIDFLKPQPLIFGLNLIQWACVAGIVALLPDLMRLCFIQPTVIRSTE